MYFVYALYSQKLDIIYVGQTDNPDRRFSEHNRGYSKYTKRTNDWKLIFKQEFPTRSEAIKRERQLKSSRGRAFLRSLLVENDQVNGQSAD